MRLTRAGGLEGVAMHNSETFDLIYREAAEHDAEQLFRWRNEGLTVEMSISEAKIDWGEHIRWLQDVLASPNRMLWIAEDHGQPVGQVRADWVADECALSWAVAPEYRKQGYGAALVKAAVDLVRSSGREGKVFAVIKSVNVPSKSIAARAGFKCVGESERIERWELQI